MQSLKKIIKGKPSGTPKISPSEFEYFTSPSIVSVSVIDSQETEVLFCDNEHDSLKVLFDPM